MIASLPRIIEAAPYSDDELLLVNLHTLVAVRLNRTGTMIITLARAELTLDAVVHKFSQFAGSSPSEAGPVVREYLNRLTAGGWLQQAESVGMSHEPSGAVAP